MHEDDRALARMLGIAFIVGLVLWGLIGWWLAS
jgi:hypothetical protein